MNMQEIKTEALVLRRINYGEADRILNLMTPQGKMAVIAKGVRREKSKLAGGVEMFSLSQLNLHAGKGELWVVTSAKMLKYYSKIVNDLARVEVAAAILKDVNLLAEGTDGKEYFEITKLGLAGLDDGLGLELVESWCLMNLARVAGEEINLYRDKVGKKLESGSRYDWDALEGVFVKCDDGEYGTSEIKLLRLMLTMELGVVARVKGIEEMSVKILRFAKAASRGVKHLR